MEQTASNLLLIRPSHFGFNAETAESNSYQQSVGQTDISAAAIKEFDAVVKILQREQIKTTVFDDIPNANTPDAIFPNNWVSFHANGVVILYPMNTPNRRREKRMDIVERICEMNGVTNPEIIDLGGYEKKGAFLEGTGSIVFDHLHKKGYVALSPRSHKAPLEEITKKTGYDFRVFETNDGNGKPIYHTNVMMSIGNRFTVICESCIENKSNRKKLLDYLDNTGRQLITIDQTQVAAFAGNMLEVKNRNGDPFLLLSETALAALHTNQKKSLEKQCSLLPFSIPNIEKVSGGSIRCMVAEIFFPQGNNKPDVQISAPKSEADFEAYYFLRWSVLRKPWHQLQGSERDDQEATSMHFMAKLPDGKLAGTARLQEMDPATAQVRYMAVAAEYHGMGIGKQLMQAMEKKAGEMGYKKIFLQARENAVAFYKANGFQIIEKTFLLYDEIQHYSMIKTLGSQG